MKLDPLQYHHDHLEHVADSLLLLLLGPNRRPLGLHGGDLFINLQKISLHWIREDSEPVLLIASMIVKRVLKLLKVLDHPTTVLEVR